MKLALGTAQFGLDYGVTNKQGKVCTEEIIKILSYAQKNDILTIDTASAYGDSEQRLGEAFATLADFQIITKTIAKSPLEVVEARFRQSLKNLKTEQVYGLLVHSVDDLLSVEGNKIGALLEKLKDQNLVQKIGISVYTEAEIIEVLKRYKIDLIQIPINVFDQRLLRSGILQQVKDKGIEIHARSLFLQGILLEEPKKLPKYFLPYIEHIMKWHSFLKNNALTPLDGAIGFAHSLGMIDYAIIGVTSLEHLVEVKTAFDKMSLATPIDYTKLAVYDESFINPHIWRL